MSKQATLSEIQKMQFSEKERAEKELLALLQRDEDAAIQKIELMPKPESLNSVNGFVTYTDGTRYFFKSHTEENEQLPEYYNVSLLAEAGYPVVNTKQVSHKPGKQIALYEIISFPTLFDLVKNEEDRELKHGATVPSRLGEMLVNAQIELDKKVTDIYQTTLQKSSIQEQANAAVNQLFSHRLAEGGRVGLFYRQKHLNLGDQSLSFETIAGLRWTINGVEYEQTLEEIIQSSRLALNAQVGPSVIGHGDAHNGNLFVDIENKKLLMFDPAFAGRHNPWLDITKPLFHNVFARWMYYPEQVSEEITLTHKIVGDRIIIEHSFKPSKLKTEFFQSRKQNIIGPLLSLLEEQKLLADNWHQYLRAALFCCPFLTVNLFADRVPNGTLSERYPMSIKLLGLSMAMELGASESQGHSYLSDMISSIFI
jgi:hypothetical protein